MTRGGTGYLMEAGKGELIVNRMEISETWVRDRAAKSNKLAAATAILLTLVMSCSSIPTPVLTRATLTPSKVPTYAILDPTALPTSITSVPPTTPTATSLPQSSPTPNVFQFWPVNLETSQQGSLSPDLERLRNEAEAGFSKKYYRTFVVEFGMHFGDPKDPAFVFFFLDYGYDTLSVRPLGGGRYELAVPQGRLTVWFKRYAETAVYLPPPDSSSRVIYDSAQSQVQIVDQAGKVTSRIALPNLASPINYHIDSGVPEYQQIYIKDFVESARKEIGDAGTVDVFEVDGYAPNRQDPRSAFARPSTQYGSITGGIIYIYTKEMEKVLGQPFYYSVMPHEYGHLRQYFLANSPSRMNSVSDWLIEGDAEYKAWRFMESRGIYSFADARNDHKQRAIKFPIGLVQLESPGAMQRDTYDAGFMAVDMLAFRIGDRSIDSFWRGLQESSWQVAFEKTFGITVAQFYGDFDKWRERNFEPPLGK